MDVDLFDQGTLATTRPAWQVIEAARRRYLTGLLVLQTRPITNVYLRDGQVYFADRSTDGGLGVRLLVEGVITREQMHRATLMVGGVEHLGRMFDRDATIDRDAVELCVELMTDDVLTTVADAPVTEYQLHLYKRHPSGVDRWLPTRVEVVTHLVSDPALLENGADVAPGEGPRSRPHLTPPPATGEVKIATAEHVPAYVAVVQQSPSGAEELEPVAAAAAPEPESFTPMRLMSLADAVTDVLPVIPSDDEADDHAGNQADALLHQPAAEHATHDDHQDRQHDDTEPYSRDDETGRPSFASVPPATFTTLQIPVVPVNGTHNGNSTYTSNGTSSDVETPATTEMPATTENPAVQVVVDVLPGSIANEVAEAVRRALAAIDNP